MSNGYLETDDLIDMDERELRWMKQDARELLTICTNVRINRDDLNRGRRELPRLIARIDRALHLRRRTA